MNRRTHLRALGAALVSSTSSVARAQPTRPIQLFVEMEVDPSREQEMVTNFHTIFLPEAKKHPGFISVKLLKLRQVVQGPSPSINYRFELLFESEELRQQWIATPAHQRVWPTIEKTLKSAKNYPVLLFDEV